MRRVDDLAQEPGVECRKSNIELATESPMSNTESEVEGVWFEHTSWEPGK